LEKMEVCAPTTRLLKKKEDWMYFCIKRIKMSKAVKKFELKFFTIKIYT